MLNFAAMDIELDIQWNSLLKELKKKFGEEIDTESILFLIGVQELGHGYKKFSKDQKLDLMHIAICTLLSPYGYYKFIGIDEDEWPHWEATKKLPFLEGNQQRLLLKRAIIEYFN
jgi:hypothetical protein